MRGLLFLLPVLILLPHLDEIAFQAGASFSDMAVSHYPNLLFLQRSLQSGILPLWSPAILSGAPFAANPLSGLWYPPGWATLLLPLPLGINLLLAMHIVWGGVGMYRLLRQEGLAEGSALFGALAFEALPKVFSHLGAGHVTLIFAVAWTPWLLYAEGRWGGARAAGQKARMLLPGIALGMIALADPRWAAYAGLTWLIYALRGFLKFAHSQSGKPIGEKRLLLVTGLVCAVNGVTALLVAAPLLVPLGEYTRLAGRAALTVGDSLTLSLPPGQLFGLMYPTIAGAAEWVLYPGAVVAALLVYALCVPNLRRASRFWLWLALLSGVVALGSNVPLVPLIWQAPGLNLLRVPARALFLTGLGLAAVAGFAVEQIMISLHARELTGTPGARSGREAAGPVLFACAAFLALFGAAAGLAVPDALAKIRFAWGAVFFTLGAGIILLARAGKIRQHGVFTALLVVCMVDLIAVNRLSLDFQPAQEMAEAEMAADYLRERESSVASKDGGAFRVYSPSYSIPQHTAAQFGLELADGVDPLRLASYDQFMERASGVPFTGYSVTLPPFASGEPAVDNLDYTPDTAMLGLLNVKYVTAAFPIQADGLTPLAQFGQTYLYQNTLALPRAWVQPANAPVGTQAREVEGITRAPNTVAVTARGPGLLVLSEINYPGWTVRVDGTPRTVQTSAGLLRAVTLAEGEHVVVFDFRPGSVYVGVALAAVFWAAFAALALAGVAQKRRGKT